MSYIGRQLSLKNILRNLIFFSRVPVFNKKTPIATGVFFTSKYGMLMPVGICIRDR